nr:hypothetical protein [Tanacetum cinerariifolium]
MLPPISPPLGNNTGSLSNSNINRVDTMPNINTTNTSPTVNVSRRVVDDDLLLPRLLDSRGESHITNVPTFDKDDFTRPSDTRDTKSIALRLKFNAFKALEGEKVNGTYTRPRCLLNDLENNRVIISQSKVNATFVNSLPRKWLSMNQTQRANISIKNDSPATFYGKYHYEEGLIDNIYASETQRFTIQASSSKALISYNHFQDSDSNVKEDNRTSNEFMADLNAQYHKSLLANQKRFYKRSGRVGSARKPMEKSKETCFACEKPGHFQKDCHSNKTSTPLYPSSNISFNKPKPHTPSFTSNIPQNSSIHQKYYKGKYKGLKANMAVLS